MKKEELENLLLIYGTDPQRWPENMRTSMETCMKSSAHFSNLHKEIQFLEGEMRQCLRPPDIPSLAMRIIEAAHPVPPTDVAATAWLRVAIAAACALILGGGIGYFTGAAPVDETLSRLTTSALYGTRMFL